METEQTWKRSQAPRIETQENRTVDEQRPGWTTILAITVPCALAGIAIGVVLGTAVAPPAAVAYVAAALFVGALALATR